MTTYLISCSKEEFEHRCSTAVNLALEKLYKDGKIDEKTLNEYVGSHTILLVRPDSLFSILREKLFGKDVSDTETKMTYQKIL